MVPVSLWDQVSCSRHGKGKVNFSYSPTHILFSHWGQGLTSPSLQSEIPCQEICFHYVLGQRKIECNVIIAQIFYIKSREAKHWQFSWHKFHVIIVSSFICVWRSLKGSEIVLSPFASQSTCLCLVTTVGLYDKKSCRLQYCISLNIVIGKQQWCGESLQFERNLVCAEIRYSCFMGRSFHRKNDTVWGVYFWFFISFGLKLYIASNGSFVNRNAVSSSCAGGLTSFTW